MSLSVNIKSYYEKWTDFYKCICSLKIKDLGEVDTKKAFEKLVEYEKEEKLGSAVRFTSKINVDKEKVELNRDVDVIEKLSSNVYFIVEIGGFRMESIKDPLKNDEYILEIPIMTIRMPFTYCSIKFPNFSKESNIVLIRKNLMINTINREQLNKEIDVSCTSSCKGYMLFYDSEKSLAEQPSLFFNSKDYIEKVGTVHYEFSEKYGEVNKSVGESIPLKKVG